MFVCLFEKIKVIKIDHTSFLGGLQFGIELTVAVMELFMAEAGGGGLVQAGVEHHKGPTGQELLGKSKLVIESSRAKTYWLVQEGFWCCCPGSSSDWPI